ncbi:hypothetical protein [Streptomyces globosus]
MTMSEDIATTIHRVEDHLCEPTAADRRIIATLLPALRPPAEPAEPRA